MPPVHLPNHATGVPLIIPAGGLLDRIVDDWRTAGWSLEHLHSFRMEEGGDESELDDLSEAEVSALQAMSDDDVKALKALKPEEVQKLVDGAALDGRIKQARDESASRRRELKPWKDLGKELGMTPDQIRDAVKNAPKKKGDKPADNDKPDVDEDEIKRKAKAESDAVANRRVVRAEVKVLARDIFADPDDAPLYIDLDDYEVDDDGDIVDKDDLIAALKKIAADKPHLAKKTPAGKKDKAQGEREHDAKPSVSRGKEMFEARKPKKADA